MTRQLMLAFMLSLTLMTAKAQTYTGKVVDTTQKPVAAVSVTLLNETGKVVAFARTGNDGAFSVILPEGKNAVNISFSMMGFAKVQMLLSEFRNGQTVVMTEEGFDLKEVKVTAGRIMQRSDTLVFSVDGFRQQQDRSIADVIRKMPGLDVNKYEEIRRQTVNEDWTAEVIADATMDDLDKDAIEKAREGYKQRYPNLADECDGWDDKVFLDKACLTIGGKITRATLLLVGKETSAHKLNHIAQIVWKCFQDGQVFGDIYTIPFIRTTSELLGRIRNYRFKIYPKNSLIPAEVWKYDTESILEGMHNSIAHQKYEMGSRIIVTETQDSLKFQNDGSFYEGDYKQYITGEKTPKSYRNPALVKAMVNIKMIDTQGYGIHKMFQSQKNRYLPMPDYDLSTSDEVVLNLPGTIIDVNYSLMLMENQSLTLTDAVLLDQVQKGHSISSEAVAMLRKRKLIEGRLPHIFVSKNIAQATDQKVEYSKHKGLDFKKCKALLLEALEDHQSLSREEIDRLWWNLLPDTLSDKQKKAKVGNMLTKIREEGVIINKTQGNSSMWSLVKSKK